MKNKIIYGFLALLMGCVNEIDEAFNEACTSSCVIVNGRFVTEDGTVGVADLSLELDWLNIGMLNGTTRKIATGRTDADGYYSFSFTPRDEELTNGDFSIEFTARDEHLIDKEQAYFSLPIVSRDTVLVRNYHIPSKAKVRLVISNLADISAPDYLSSTVLYERDNLDNDIRVVSGILDTRYSQKPSVTYAAAGGQYTYIALVKRKGEVVETSLDSLIIPTNQEGVYELTF